MHIEYLTIGSAAYPFKNLYGVSLSFPRQSIPDPHRHKTETPRDLHTHALIGQNGCGKSNLIEAIITIFRDLDTDGESRFDYDLTYHIRGHEVHLQADKSRQEKFPFLWVDGERQPLSYLQEHRSLLPAHIFAYYSGKSTRMQELFQKHQRRFLQAQTTGSNELLDQDDHGGVRGGGRTRDDRLRRLFYCHGAHSQLVLLSCLIEDDEVFTELLRDLDIAALESALFILQQPHTMKQREQKDALSEDDFILGDERFWYTKGTFVSEFLDKLWQTSWAPIRKTEERLIDFRGRTEFRKLLYCYVPDQESLKQLGEQLGTDESFFRYAEGAYLADLIDDIRITVKKTGENGSTVEFTELSEGELQMLTVLGLMRVTTQDDCLFLLDEPDTHLNPIWKLRYFDSIERVLKPRDDDLIHGQSQIIITTHDPMMIGSLRREQVQIISRNEQPHMPDIHPQGMGVTGLLKSDVFGLSSTLDLETERRLLRRNELLARKSDAAQALSAEENEELTLLSDELADLGFSSADFRDPDYALFVRMMAAHKQYRKPNLTQAEREEQDRIARQYIEEILREEADA